MSRRRAVAIAIAIALPFPATAWPPYRLHPEFGARAAAVRRVGLVTPSVLAYDLSYGVATIRDDWAERIRGNLLAAVERSLRKRKLAVTRLDPSAEWNADLRGVHLLYEAVEGAILEATYANAFVTKKGKGFDYSVGDLGALLAGEGLDGLVFVSARTVAGPFGDVPDVVAVGMVDRSGAVVWFSSDRSTNADVRDPASAVVFAENLIDPLPLVRR